jgi:hypothetical protein
MQYYASLSADILKRWADQFNTMMKEGHMDKVLETLYK